MTPVARAFGSRRRPSERLRAPQPLIRTRIPSGRGAMEQPNATGDGDLALTVEFWVLLVATGLATGLFGDLLMFVLNSVIHLAFGGTSGSFQAAVESTSWQRRVVVLGVGGLVTGVGWYLLRRFTAGRPGDLDDSLWTGTGELSFRRCSISALLSEVAVGSGASLGREAAPKLMGAVSGSVLARWRQLTPAQRRLLVACGAGAGMAAVYNVPIGGALIAAEILYGSITLPVVLPALVCAWLATVTSWLYLPVHPTYTNVPAFPVTATQLVWAIVAGPVIGLIAVPYIRLIGWVSHHRVSGRWAAVAPAVAFAALGGIAVVYPQLLGNGQDMAEQAFLGQVTLGLSFALFALKPLVTALCLGSGATGGLFTPTLSTGAMLGAFLGLVWSLLWPGAPAGSFALIGAAALLAAGTQAPLSSLVLIVELTHTADTLIVPIITAVASATLVARYVDGYSIYSARLPRSRGRKAAVTGSSPGIAGDEPTRRVEVA
jgi:chloride channel protein, CIC family